MSPYENATLSVEQLRKEYARYIYLARRCAAYGDYYGKKQKLWYAKCVREEIERRGETVR